MIRATQTGVSHARGVTDQYGTKELGNRSAIDNIFKCVITVFQLYDCFNWYLALNGDLKHVFYPHNLLQIIPRLECLVVNIKHNAQSNSIVNFQWNPLC